MPARTSPAEAADRHAGEVERLARPLDAPSDLDPLLEHIDRRPYVLLGEASHGTSEFHTWRAEITKRLITERGARFVAVEGDWPDCSRVNRWVRGLDDGPEPAAEVLLGFERWPTWMWANHEVAGFLDWLRDHNTRLPVEDRVGFYGLDVYSLWDSIDAVTGYVAEHEPASLDAVRGALQCFDPYGEDPQAYAWATRRLSLSCEDALIDLLQHVRRTTRLDLGVDDHEARFDAEQNAQVAVNAERYYRAMVGGGASSWNVRDTHMADTLDRLVEHHGGAGPAVVWEHNTHIGDARATPMAHAGMINVGQLVRERHGAGDVALVGFGCHEGTVVASDEWGGALHRTDVPPSRAGSHERLIHDVVGGSALFTFPTGDDHEPSRWLAESRGHRAIGVVYDVERAGNWVPTVLGRRYDAFCHLERTTALHPLHGEPPVAGVELATFPSNR